MSVAGLSIGCARVSTDAQDLTAQREALAMLGVAPDRVYVDHGLTGTGRDRPGLRQALAACRAGDELVVTKLDRLARSLPDARAIADELTRRQVKLNLGGSVHDPTDPVGRRVQPGKAVPCPSLGQPEPRTPPQRRLLKTDVPGIYRRRHRYVAIPQFRG